MDLNFSVVLDKTQFAELVHEEVDARSGRSDHLRQGLLAILSSDRLRLVFLAEIREQKEKPGEALFGRIEQLVDQVSCYPDVPRQQIRHEKLGKFRLIENGRDHGRL